MQTSKYVSYDKMSKKQRSAVDKRRRVMWKMNPVTRKPKNPKAYDRNKQKAYSQKYGYADSVVLNLQYLCKRTLLWQVKLNGC